MSLGAGAFGSKDGHCEWAPAGKQPNSVRFEETQSAVPSPFPRFLSQAVFVVLCLSPRKEASAFLLLAQPMQAILHAHPCSQLAYARTHSPAGTILARGVHSPTGVEHSVCLRRLINDP